MYNCSRNELIWYMILDNSMIKFRQTWVKVCTEGQDTEITNLRRTFLFFSHLIPFTLWADLCRSWFILVISLFWSIRFDVTLVSIVRSNLIGQNKKNQHSNVYTIECKLVALIVKAFVYKFSEVQCYLTDTTQAPGVLEPAFVSYTAPETGKLTSVNSLHAG